MCGTNNFFVYESITLSVFMLNMNPLTQDFVSLRPELIHKGALPLKYIQYLKITFSQNYIKTNYVKYKKFICRNQRKRNS